MQYFLSYLSSYEDIFWKSWCENALECLGSPELCTWSEKTLPFILYIFMIATAACRKSPAWQKLHNCCRLSGRCGLSWQAATWCWPSPPSQACFIASWNTVYKMKRISSLFVLHLHLVFGSTKSGHLLFSHILFNITQICMPLFWSPPNPPQISGYCLKNKPIIKPKHLSECQQSQQN